MHEYSEKNRRAWNTALRYHQKARGGALISGFAHADFSTLNRDCDAILQKKLREIDLTGKSVAHLPCNNGRELLSLIKLGAKDGIGFDISDAAIEEARELAAISGLPATFMRTDILDIANTYDGAFDFIYISEGSLQWFEDLTAFFAVVSRLLKTRGQLLIYEMHPFAYFFELMDENADTIPIEDFLPYFEKGPYTYTDGLDYIGGEHYEDTENRWFMHTLSDIMSALLKNGLAIISFDEYNTELGDNALTRTLDKFPLSYILTGCK